MERVDRANEKTVDVTPKPASLLPAIVSGEASTEEKSSG
jgi:hypothetical protein